MIYKYSSPVLNIQSSPSRHTICTSIPGTWYMTRADNILHTSVSFTRTWKRLTTGAIKRQRRHPFFAARCTMPEGNLTTAEVRVSSLFWRCSSPIYAPQAMLSQKIYSSSSSSNCCAHESQSQPQYHIPGISRSYRKRTNSDNSREYLLHERTKKKKLTRFRKKDNTIHHTSKVVPDTLKRRLGLNSSSTPLLHLSLPPFHAARRRSSPPPPA